MSEVERRRVKAYTKSQGLLKTGEEDKYKKVAKFLVLIGKDEAAGVLAELDKEQVEKITAEILKIEKIPNKEAEQILAEFHELLRRDILGEGLIKTDLSQGGVATARKMLKKAFGKEAGEAILKKTIPESGLKPFDFLESYTGEQVGLMLAGEAPSTIALILARISPPAAAAAIRHLDAALRTDVIKRMANMGRISPEILDRVAAALREKARDMGRSEEMGLDGTLALAEILKRAEYALSEQLLAELAFTDAILAEEIRKRLYTLDDVLQANNRPIQDHLRSLEDKDIVYLLKGKKEAFCEKILSNLSKTRRALIEEELSLSPPLPRKDVEAATGDFLAWFRQEREAGKIILEEDSEEYV